MLSSHACAVACVSLPHTPLVIIPSRLQSMRLPGKALALIAGKPMVVRVAERAAAAAIGPVLVATDNHAISDAVTAAGFCCVLTGRHPSGSDRVAEAAALTDPDRRHNVIVNLQGDEPEIAPAALRAVLTPLDDPAVDMATLAAPLAGADRTDRNAVKLWGDLLPSGHVRAARFTRAEPPPDTAAPPWRHVGVYAFRRAVLARFVGLPPSPGERREALEQVRALDAGMRIDAALVEAATRGVDTPADLQRVRERLEKEAS